MIMHGCTMEEDAPRKKVYSSSKTKLEDGVKGENRCSFAVDLPVKLDAGAPEAGIASENRGGGSIRRASDLDRTDV